MTQDDWENDFDPTDTSLSLPADAFDLPDDIELIDSEPSKKKIPFDPTLIDTPIPQSIIPLPPTSVPTPLKAQRPSDAQPGEKYINYNRVFQSLAVKWDQEKPYKVLASHRKRALLVGWSTEDLLSVEKSLGIYTSVPRKCPGKSVYKKDGSLESGGCHCEQRFGANPDVWKGTLCPAEQMRIYELFAKYVRELEISPEDGVDLEQVADLIRIHLQLERCDQILSRADDGLMIQAITHVDQKASRVHRNTQINVAFNAQKSLRADRDALYNHLIATRAKKAKTSLDKAKTAGGIMGAMVMGDIASALAESRLPSLQEEQTQLNKSAEKRRKENSIEGEFADMGPLYADEEQTL